MVAVASITENATEIAGLSSYRTVHPSLDVRHPHCLERQELGLRQPKLYADSRGGFLSSALVRSSVHTCNSSTSWFSSPNRDELSTHSQLYSMFSFLISSSTLSNPNAQWTLVELCLPISDRSWRTNCDSCSAFASGVPR